MEIKEEKLHLVHLYETNEKYEVAAQVKNGVVEMARFGYLPREYFKKGSDIYFGVRCDLDEAIELLCNLRRALETDQWE